MGEGNVTYRDIETKNIICNRHGLRTRTWTSDKIMTSDMGTSSDTGSSENIGHVCPPISDAYIENVLFPYPFSRTRVAVCLLRTRTASDFPFMTYAMNLDDTEIKLPG